VTGVSTARPWGERREGLRLNALSDMSKVSRVF
jgi:hypothetical protein